MDIKKLSDEYNPGLCLIPTVLSWVWLDQARSIMFQKCLKTCKYDKYDKISQKYYCYY